MQVDDEIDLKELFSAIWQGKWVIIVTTFIAAVIAVFYALSLPNIYKSEVLLAPAEENQGGGMSALASQFGGLAAIAGVNLSGGGADKTTLALEVFLAIYLAGTIREDAALVDTKTKEFERTFARSAAVEGQSRTAKKMPPGRISRSRRGSHGVMGDPDVIAT